MDRPIVSPARRSPASSGVQRRPIEQDWPSKRVVLAAAVAIATAVLGIVGCSTGSETPVPDAASGVDSSSDTESSSEASVAKDHEGSADDGVASDLLAAANAQTFANLSKSINPPPEYFQIIRECMNAQGFEFMVGTPERLIPQGELTALLEEVAGLDPTSSLYRNRYGYGVTTVAAYLDIGSNPREPNEDLINQMSPSEQQAWVAALYGPRMAGLFDPEHGPQQADPDGQFLEVLIEPGGCAEEARPSLEIESGLTEEESVALTEMILQVTGSEDYVRLEQDWARCAADQGFADLASIESVSVLLYSKFEELRRPGPIGGAELERLLGLTEAELASMTSKEVEDRLEEEPFRYTLEDLELLQQEELEIARRLWDCDTAFFEGYAEIEASLFPDG